MRFFIKTFESEFYFLKIQDFNGSVVEGFKAISKRQVEIDLAFF